MCTEPKRECDLVQSRPAICHFVFCDLGMPLDVCGPRDVQPGRERYGHAETARHSAAERFFSYAKNPQCVRDLQYIWTLRLNPIGFIFNYLFIFIYLLTYLNNYYLLLIVRTLREFGIGRSPNVETPRGSTIIRSRDCLLKSGGAVGGSRLKHYGGSRFGRR